MNGRASGCLIAGTMAFECEEIHVNKKRTQIHTVWRLNAYTHMHTKYL